MTKEAFTLKLGYLGGEVEVLIPRNLVRFDDILVAVAKSVAEATNTIVKVRVKDGSEVFSVSPGEVHHG